MEKQKGSYGCPLHNAAESDLHYGDYLKIPELLSLQVPLSKPPHHDELLFIVIHQAYELWFKLVLHEMDSAIQTMTEGKVLRAHHFMVRIGQILKLLLQQIHILETMSPIEFLEFRENLKPASGFQSIQFREMEFLAGLKDESYLTYFKKRPEALEKLNARFNGSDLKSAHYELLRKLGYSIPTDAYEREKSASPDARHSIIQGILPIYQKPSDHLPVYLLTESLVEFDQSFLLWRDHHMRVVERIIGTKPGTGGSEGVAYLQATTNKKCFPVLWEVRAHLNTGGKG